LFPIGFCIVDGKDILNDRGINWPPRNLVKEFFITASPNVFDGEILGLGNAPFQGFFFFTEYGRCSAHALRRKAKETHSSDTNSQHQLTQSKGKQERKNKITAQMLKKRTRNRLRLQQNNHEHLGNAEESFP
jgi:hypothetical protein